MSDTSVTGKGVSGALEIVLVSGCFDLLHVGHVRHLIEARAMGSFLFVALTHDEFVGKGIGRPIVSFNERAEQLRELRCVTAVLGTDNSVDAIYQCAPSIFVKGIDYADKGLLPAEIEACHDVGAQIRFTSAEKKSTSGLIDSIIKLEKHRHEALTMWNRTEESLPPKHEILAVVRKLSSRGEYAHEDAVWDGENWTERKTQQRSPKSAYYLWRRLET